MSQLGRTVGRYEIEGELGRGGMAVVYLAHQIGLERKVALKQLGGFHAQDSGHALRFLHESRLVGSLNHPNIVTVFDYFEDQGIPYISMELVERGPLRRYLGRMTLAQVFGVLEGVLSGLEIAHSRSIVHRDLKPENVMVTWDGRVKVADFGIAKALDVLTTAGFATGTGNVVGTPAYMAPEQAMAGEIGPWSDLYSLGVMAYEMFVGRLPFESADTPLKVLMRHAVDPVPPPLSIRPDLDPGIARWIERLLAKVPRDRFWTAREAWDALEERATALLGPAWRRDAPLGDLAEATAGAEATGYTTYDPPAVARPPAGTTVPPPAPPPVPPAAPPAHGPAPAVPAAVADTLAPEPTQVRPAPPTPSAAPRLGRVTRPLTLAVGAAVGMVIAAVLLLSGERDPGRRSASLTGGADAQQVEAFQASVGAICDALDKDRAGLPARHRTLQRRLRRAKSVSAQREALLTEYKHVLSVSGQLLPRLEALPLPEARLRPLRSAAVTAWRRNQSRLEARRDRIDRARTFAELQKAAAVRNRTTIERDGQRLNRRLIQLSPSTCEFSVSPSGPVITLRNPAGSSGDVAPMNSKDVSPSATAVPQDAAPAPAAPPAPDPTDVSPGGGTSGGGED